MSKNPHHQSQSQSRKSRHSHKHSTPRSGGNYYDPTYDSASMQDPAYGYDQAEDYYDQHYDQASLSQGYSDTGYADSQADYRESQHLSVNGYDRRHRHRHDVTGSNPYYDPNSEPGRNADYYESGVQYGTPNPGSVNLDVNLSQGDSERGDSSRGLGGAMAGGAAGYYLGHKRRHGLLGAVGGALLGHYLQENRRDGHPTTGGSSYYGSEHWPNYGSDRSGGRRRTKHHRRHGSRY